MRTNRAKKDEATPIDHCEQLLKATEEAFEARGERLQSPLVNVIDEGAMHLRTSRRAFPRALGILKYVIRACESKGWTVEPDGPLPVYTNLFGVDSARVRIGDVAVPFEIWERTSAGENSIRQATGMLVLEISGYGEAYRRQWGGWQDPKARRDVG